jgi:hypothetical protein
MPLAQKVRHLAEEAFGVRRAFVLCFGEPCPFFDLLVFYVLSPLLFVSAALYHITGASFNPCWGMCITVEAVEGGRRWNADPTTTFALRKLRRPVFTTCAAETRSGLRSNAEGARPAKARKRTEEDAHG